MSTQEDPASTQEDPASTQEDPASTQEDSGVPVRIQLLQRLQSLHRAGVVAIPRPVVVKPPAEPTIPDAGTAKDVVPTDNAAKATEKAAKATEKAAKAAVRSEMPEVAQVSAGGETVPNASPASQPVTDPVEALRLLNDEVCACTRCPELVQNRTQTVFGVGNVRPRLCFFGEGPGADEDRLGEPFVGAAGQLLDKVISAMGLKREEVYILNVVKCRPPGNRTPTEEEANHCRPFFTRQLEILQPEIICCLGGCAAKTLLQTNDPVGRLRGRFHSYENSKVVVTYHPAYLLRRPEEKGKTWSDMKMVMKELEGAGS